MFSKTVQLKGFQTRLNKIEKSFINNAKISLKNVGERILNDALMLAPTPRINTGNLRGSYFVSVGNKIYVQSTKGNSNSVQTSTENFGLRVGFTMPYSEEAHEGFINTPKGKIVMGFGGKSKKATPKTGNFFLSEKIKKFGKKYIELFEEFFKDSLDE